MLATDCSARKEYYCTRSAASFALPMNMSEIEASRTTSDGGGSFPMPWRGVSATCSCSATFFRRVLTHSCRHALHFGHRKVLPRKPNRAAHYRQGKLCQIKSCTKS